MEESPAGLIPVDSFSIEVDPKSPASINEFAEGATIHLTMAAIDIKSSASSEPTVIRLITRPNFSDSDSEGEDSDDDESEFERTAILCTLSPKHCFQQRLDLYLTPNEQSLILTDGPHKVSITGNVVLHPFDDDEDEEDDDFDSEDYLNEDVSDDDELDYTSGARIEEINESSEEEVEEEKPKTKKETKASKKRAAEAVEPKAAPEKSKKQKKTEEKKVAFSKELEQGPTPSEPKSTKSAEPKAKKLAGGITIEDKKVGSGPVCKKGDKVSVRYIGKLQNGKTFDSNTSGTPFQFKLGAGQVIKGWDIGVAGMAVKGERRIIIPAPMAYGSQSLPGIPANSTLVFDVKLVGIK